MQKPAESTSQRIVKAVRKIAKTAQEEDGRLGIATPKAAIDKTRGVAFYNANGDMDSTDGDIPADAKKDNDSDDDSTTKDGESTLITDDLQQGDDAGEFKAYDCTTGQELNIDLAPIPGQEYPTPDGWDGYDQAPVDPSYVEGKWYSFPSHSSNKAPTIDLSIQLINEWGAANGSSYYYDYLDNGIIARYYLDGTYAGQSAGTVGSCTGSDEGEWYCNPTPQQTQILGAEWPDDGRADLALINGQFAASQYDGDAPAAYKDNPPSEIEICDGLGNRYSITALEDGKSMITKVDFGGNVDPDGHSVIIGDDGVVADRIGNAVRNSYLP